MDSSARFSPPWARPRSLTNYGTSTTPVGAVGAPPRLNTSFSGRLDSRAGMNTPSRCLAHSSRARAKGECVCSPFGDSGFLGRPDLH